MNRLVGSCWRARRWRDVVPSTGAPWKRCGCCVPCVAICARWVSPDGCAGPVRAGLPVIRQMRSTTTDRRTCCGYWGRRSPRSPDRRAPAQEIRSPRAIGASALRIPSVTSAARVRVSTAPLAVKELRRLVLRDRSHGGGSEEAVGTRHPSARSGRRVP